MKPWMPCLSANLPVATEFQSIGGSQITHYSAIDETVKSRHQTLLEHGRDMFPVSRVPTDKKHLPVSHNRICPQRRPLKAGS